MKSAGISCVPRRNELVERVLAVGAGLAPEDLAGLGGHRGAVPAHGLAVRFHSELLQVGREAVQVLVVRQHGVRGDLEEVAVPHVDHAHDHHGVLLERRLGEVLVDLTEACEELLEAGRSEHDGEREANGGIDGVTAADPIPEAECVRRVDAEVLDALEVGRNGDEVLLNGLGLLLGGTVDGTGGLQLLEQPCAGLTGVGERLERAEGLRHNHEQRGLRVEVAGLLGEVVRVDVRDVAGPDAGVGVRLERPYTMTGPRPEPPMPMLTTVSISLPVTPFHSPERTLSAKAYMRSRVSRTSLTTS